MNLKRIMMGFMLIIGFVAMFNVDTVDASKPSPEEVRARACNICKVSTYIFPSKDVARGTGGATPPAGHPPP